MTQMISDGTLKKFCDAFSDSPAAFEITYNYLLCLEQPVPEDMPAGMWLSVPQANTGKWRQEVLLESGIYRISTTPKGVEMRPVYSSQLTGIYLNVGRDSNVTRCQVFNATTNSLWLEHHYDRIRSPNLLQPEENTLWYEGILQIMPGMLLRKKK